MGLATTIIYTLLSLWVQAFHIALAIWHREVGWLTVDRRTKQFKREQQPLLKKLKLLLLFNPITEWIDTTHAMRLWTHEKNYESGIAESKPKSHKQIRKFVQFYKIDMSQFEPSNVEEYTTFEDFFIRRHKPGSRPIYEKDDDSTATVVADSRVVVFPTLERSRALWIKGTHFTISNLIDDEEESRRWANGSVASFRLSPQDYHRFHSPVPGTVCWHKHIPGDYYQVDPVALRSSVDILTRNARSCLCIESKKFGKVLFVAIGATDVGSVVINEELKNPGQKVSKGDQIGYFQYGGSSIIVAFEPERIEFDEDLEDWSRKQIMVDVEVGMSLGRAKGDFSSHQMAAAEQAPTTAEQTSPVEKPTAAEQASPIDKPTTPEQPPPTEKATTAEQTQPIEKATPAERTSPIDQPTTAKQTPPTEKATPAERSSANDKPTKRPSKRRQSRKHSR